MSLLQGTKEIALEQLNFSEDDFSTLRTLAEQTKITNASVDLFFRYLFALGYLTQCGVHFQEPSLDENKMKVKIPNLEVTRELKRKLIDYFQNSSDYANMLNVGKEIRLLLESPCTHTSRQNCSTDKLQAAIQKLFAPLQFVDFQQQQDSGIHKNEFFLQCLIIGSFFLARDPNTHKFGGEV